jgi:hypothetical protein
VVAAFAAGEVRQPPPRRPDHQSAVTDVAISISLAVLLTAIVWCLWKYAGLKAGHAAVCILLGYSLGATAVSPFLRQAVTGLAQLISSLHF